MESVLADNGWVKLHRDLRKWKYYYCPEMLLLWIHLLFEAHHGDDCIFDGYGNKIMRGQFSTGRERIAKELKMNASKVERFLKKLEIEHQIEQRKTNKCRIITIVNWEKYQISNIESNNNRTTTEQQPNNNRTQNKNVKNEKNEKNNKAVVSPLSVVDRWNQKIGIPHNKLCAGIGAGKHLANFKNSINFSPLNEMSGWEKLFELCLQSDFLMKSAFMSLYWLIDYDNAVKVLSGNYGNKSPSSGLNWDEVFEGSKK